MPTPIATITGGVTQVFLPGQIVGGTYDIAAWAAGLGRPLALWVFFNDTESRPAIGFQSGNFGGVGFWYATIDPSQPLATGHMVLQNEDTGVSQDFGVATIGPQLVSWYYGNQQDVEDMMGAFNLEYASNQENQTPGIDAQRLLRAGLWADSQINLGLNEAYTVPLVNLGPDDTEYINGINIDFVIAQLVHWRIVQYAGNDDTNRETLYQTLITGAKEALRETLSGQTPLISQTPLYTLTAPQGNQDALDVSGNRMYSNDRDILIPTSQDLRRARAFGWMGGFHA